MAEPDYQAQIIIIPLKIMNLATYAKKLDKAEAELNWQLSADAN